MTQLTTVLRWTARIGSLATLSLVLLAAGSQLSGNADPPRFHEWIGLGLFPAGVCAGLVVAFFRERQGGLISIASLVGFYLWHLTVSGTLPTGPYFAILTSPALLWLLSAQLSESVKPVQGAACGKENVHDGHASERPNSTPPSVFTNDSTATKTDDRLLGRTAIVVASVHHENTLKVAGVIAEALDAVLFTLEQAKAADLSEFDLVGFGSGIYFGQHHSALRKLVHCLDAVPQNVFVFSTAGLPFLSPCFHWRLKQALRHAAAESSTNSAVAAGTP